MGCLQFGSGRVQGQGAVSSAHWADSARPWESALWPPPHKVWEAAWGLGSTAPALAYCSSGGWGKRTRNRTRRAELEDCPWILVGRGVGGHWKDPVPQVQQSRGGGRQGRVALEGGGVSPGRYGSSGGSEGAGEEQRQGRQRLHTRLYPVEISRALKSSESMLPVCFCSQDAGIAEARPRVGPMCTADRQHSGGGSRETGGPETQVRGKVSRDVRKEAREPGRQHMMAEER